MFVPERPSDEVLPMQVVPVRLSRGTYSVSVGLKEGPLVDSVGVPRPPPRVVIVKTLEVEVR
jgi:hypothetical protein